MKSVTLEYLNKLYFDYMGYFWCQSILTVGDVSDINDNLELLAKELKLNLLHYDQPHDLKIFERFIIIVNPDHTIDPDDEFYYHDDTILFTKKPPIEFSSSYAKIIVPEEELSYEYLKKLLLMMLIYKHGKIWLFEEFDEIIL